VDRLPLPFRLFLRNNPVKMVVGAIKLVEGIIAVLSLGFYCPNWTFSFAHWHMTRKMRILERQDSDTD
jgi:hypothetical protein